MGPIEDVASNRSASLPDSIFTNPEQDTSLVQYRSAQYHACICRYIEHIETDENIRRLLKLCLS